MAGDFNKPVVTDNYALVYTPIIVENMKALAQGLDPAVVNPANLPINTIRWNSVNKHDEIFTGATWVEKCDVYSISISGSAGYATTAGTAGTANALNNGLNYSVHSAITFNNGGVGTGYMVSNEPTWGFLHRPSVNGTTAAHAWTNAAGTVIGYMTSAGAMAVSSVTSTTHIAFGSGGTSAAGTIYSDANWGCVFRAKQTSPTIADFEFQTSAGVTALRIDSSNAYFTTQRTVLSLIHI